MEHWTNNEDLLERFVLNRLDKRDRVQLEEHLHACEICRKAVAQETRIAAAARQWGRDDLRSRLRNRIAGSEEQRIPWGRIVSAAAIIILIVGIGTYNDWFSLIQRDPQLIETEVFTDTAERATEPSGEELTSPPVAKSATPELSKPPAQPAEPRAERKAYEHDLVVTDEASVGAERDVPKGEAAGAAQQGFIGSETRMMQRPAQPEPGQWVTGWVIEEESGIAADALKEDQPQPKIYGRSEKDMDDTRRKVSAEGLQNFTVDQRPLNELPSWSQQQSGSGQFPVLVQKTRGGIQLTLFAEPMFYSTDLKHAAVHPVTSDSLILILPQKRIGLRIPGGWQIDDSLEMRISK